MLKEQIKLGYGLEFFDIQFANGKWYAWYIDNTEATINDAINEAQEIADADN